MDVLNGKVDYFQRIFREFPSSDTHGNKFWLVHLIDINNLEGCSVKQFGRRCSPKRMPNPLRCQVLLWNAEVISLHFSLPAVHPGLKGCSKVAFCSFTHWGSLDDGVRWGASPDSWHGNEDGTRQGWVQRWHPPTFPALRVKDTMLWSQILWNSWEACHQIYRALD